jgi:hypothetical protein
VWYTKLELGFGGRDNHVIKGKSLAKVECLILCEVEADSLSDYQHQVAMKLGGLFAEDELQQDLAGLTILKMEPVNP